MKDEHHTSASENENTFVEDNFNDDEIIQNEQTGTDEEEKKFKCNLCNFGHYSECHVVLHKNIHRGFEELQCPFCRKLFLKKNHCLRHMETHKNFGKYPTNENCSDDEMSENEQKTFKCDLCNYEHHDEIRVILHKNTHKGLMENQCPLCKKVLSRVGSVMRHMSTQINCWKVPAKKITIDETLIDDEVSFIIRDDNVTIYKCDSCDFTHQNKQYLFLHKRTHKGLKERECPFCLRIFLSIRNCVRHITNTHKNEMFLKKTKTIVEKNVNEIIQRELIPLIKNDEKERKFKCDHCDFAHHHESHVILHTNIHKDLNETQCPACYKLLPSQQDCLKHLQKHAKFRKYPKNETTDDDTSSGNEQTDEGEGEIDERKKFKCDLCDFSHQKEEHLILHKGSHKGLKETECPLCPRTYKQKSRCIKHIIAAHIYNNNQCEICGSCFHNFHAFINHKLQHEAEENPIICNICGKRFLTIITFKRHEITHRDDRPRYTCEQCKRIFVDRRAYRIHSQTKHKEDEESEDTENGKNRNKFTCLICSQSFQSKEHLDKHMKRKHDVIIQQVITLPKS